jgi:hypothetical protein
MQKSATKKTKMSNWKKMIWLVVKVVDEDTDDDVLTR